MAATPKISPLPQGTAEGAIVLEVERGITEAGVAQVARALERFPGVWGLLLDAGEAWGADGFAALQEAAGERALLVRMEFGAADWPPQQVRLQLDASRLVREATTDRELAARLGSVWPPEVADLLVELEHDQLPPSPGVLAMLEAALSPALAYVYAPTDYAYRALLVQHVAAVSPLWSVRWL